MVMQVQPAQTQRNWSTKARHLWLDEGDAKRLIGPVGLQRLTQQIRQSETQHRGEIRLCIEAALPLRHLLAGVGPRQRAQRLFRSLGVGQTQGRNGVLIYLLLADQAIELMTDPALQVHVDTARWHHLVVDLQQQFKAGQFEAGLGQAISAIDTLLRQHCPAQVGQRNPNELPDEPVLL